MTLPIFQTDSKDLLLIQTNWSSQINPVLSLPINQGIILKSIVLTTGENTINHKLGRPLQGWFLVRQRALASIYDKQDTNTYPQLSLILQSNANVTVDLFVF